MATSGSHVEGGSLETRKGLLSRRIAKRIAAVFRARATTAIFLPRRRAIAPLQDVLGSGSEARMNTPGLAAGNWTWRARESDFTPEHAARLRRLAELTGRLPRP